MATESVSRDKESGNENEPAIEVASPITGEVIRFTRSGPVIPGVEITDVSLTLPAGLSEDEWLNIGWILGRHERRSMWCIGDWWAYGSHEYGDRRYHANNPEWQGPTWLTCMVAGTVARKFDKTLRRRKVPFGHHQAAAGIKDINAALALLERAERHGLSVQQVKAEVRAYKQRNLLADRRNAQSVGSGEVFIEDEMEFSDRFKPSSVDALITDPPYATDVDDIESFSAWVHRWLPKLKPTGRAYIFTGAYPNELLAYLKRLCPPPEGWQLDAPLVWTYRNTLGPSPTHTYKLNWQACFHLYGPKAPPLTCPWMKEQFGVQDIAAPDGRHGNRYHSWQKPDELAERLISHSTTEQDLVVDPFCGSGTFVLAARRLGRRGQGADADPQALNIFRQRMEAEDA